LRREDGIAPVIEGASDASSREDRGKHPVQVAADGDVAAADRGDRARIYEPKLSTGWRLPS
jgi:hypothetical protein